MSMPKITKIEVESFTWDIVGLTHGRAFHYDPDSTLTRHASAIKIYADNGVVVLSLVGGGQSGVVALRTMDGGETWTSELIVSGDVGVLYLTRDAKFLTVYSLLQSDQVTVFEYKGS